MDRWIKLSGLAMLALLALLATAGCGGNTAAPDAANLQVTAAEVQIGAPERSMAIDLPTAIAEIDALEAPADVDNAVFAEMKAELARLLGEPGLAASGSDGQRGLAVVSDPQAYDAGDDYIQYYIKLPMPYAGSSGMRAAFTLPGDFDGNGFVGSADIVPLARYLGREVTDNSPYYLKVMDADGNGLVSIADITGIARHWGLQVTRLAIYRSMEVQDYPWIPGEKDRISPALFIPRSGFSPGATNSFPHFDYIVPGLKAGEYHWARVELSSGSLRAGWISRSLPGGPLQVDLQLAYDGARLSCLYYLPGDLDNNLNVNASDISGIPLQYHKGQDIQELGNELPEFMDRNLDGHVGHADGMAALSEISNYFGSTIDHYVVNWTLDPLQLPGAGGIEPQEITATAFDIFESKVQGSQPLRLEFETGALPPGSYVWVDNGIVYSEVIQIP